MQVAMNKCFLLDLKKKKNGAYPSCRFREKHKKLLNSDALQFQKRQDGYVPNFFQGLGQSTC